MRAVIVKWVCLVAAAFAVGPVARWLVSLTPAPDGGDAATAFLSAGPLRSTVLTAAAMALAGVAGAVTARAASVRSGLFACGLVLVWAAATGGRLEEIVRFARESSVLFTLAVEGGVIGAASLALGWVVVRSASLSAQEESVSLPVGPLVGAAVGGIAAWAVARNGLAGQTIAAATAAGVFGTLVGCVVDQRSSLWWYLGIGMVWAVAGPLFGLWMHGSGLVEAVYAGDVAALARIAPLDWAAGSFLGVPMGHAWAASMIDRRVEGAAGKAAAA